MLLGGSAVATAGEPSRASVPPVEVELVAAAKSAEPGQPLRLGVRFQIQPDWHVYWKNSGDSGLPVTIDWTLPPGWEAGPIEWPVPHRLVGPSGATFAYEGEVLLPVTLRVPPTAPPGDAEVAAVVDWLVCAEECELGKATLSLRVPVRAGAPEADARTAPWFAAAAARRPRAFPGTARASLAREHAVLDLDAAGPWADPAATLAFFAAESPPWALPDGQPVERDAVGTRVFLPLSTQPGAPAPPRIVGTLEVASPTSWAAFDVDVPVAGTWAGSEPARRPSPLAHLRPAPHPPAEPAQPLALLLLGAVVGGLILNVTPCVLPVLSIKVLGFLARGGKDPRRARRHGYAFGLGVLASFWAMAAVVLALRSGGQAVGWGFQMQDPRFVGAMALLFVLLGLNLAGVFEIGTAVAGAAAGVESRAVESGGYAASFSSGALATIVATPCAVPFMTAPVAFALTAPAPLTMLVFTALGAGMATPYVALAASPRLLAKVPRPGPWLVVVKRAFSFAMFGAAVWMSSIFGLQVGVLGLTWLLAAAVGLGAAAWAYGVWGGVGAEPRARLAAGTLLPLLLLAGVVLGTLRGARHVPEDDHRPPEGWLEFTPTVVAEQRAKGRVVFVDFTAAWCGNCKANDALFLETDAVESAAARLGVARVRADWTSKSEVIHSALQALGRESVPTYAVYPADAASGPEVLPAAITSGTIVDAFERAVARRKPGPSSAPGR